MCEGYTDVIGCFQAGVPARRRHLRHRARRGALHAAAQLRPAHRARLRRRRRRPDRHRRGSTSGSASTRSTSSWPRCRPGSDPGRAGRGGPRRPAPRPWRRAEPFLQFRLDRILGRRPLDTPRAGPGPPTRRSPAIAEHPSDLVRDQYVMTVSDRCRLEPDLLRRRLDDARRSARRGDGRRARSGRAPGRRAAEPARSRRRDRGRARRGRAPPRRCAGRARRTPARPGLEALRFAVHRPEAVADRLEAVLFVDELQRRAFVDPARGRRASTRRSTTPRPTWPTCCAGWRWRSRSSPTEAPADPVDARGHQPDPRRGAPGARRPGGIGADRARRAPSTADGQTARVRLLDRGPGRSGRMVARPGGGC